MKAVFRLRDLDAGAAIEAALADPGLRSLTLDFKGAIDPEIYRSMVRWLARLPSTAIEELIAISASFEHAARYVELSASSPLVVVRPVETVVAVLGDYVALGLETAGLPSALRSFAILQGGLTAAGMARLVPVLPSALSTLSFRENRLDAPAVDALLARFPKSVVDLDLGANPLGDAGAVLLAESAQLNGLSQLRLDGAAIGDLGAQSIAQSASLQYLARLDLSRNPMSDIAVRSLTHRFGPRVILEGRTR